MRSPFVVVVAAASVVLAQQTPAPTAAWPLFGNSSEGECSCISDHPKFPGNCTKNEDPFDTYAPSPDSDTMRYVFAANTNVSHFHLFVPACVNASDVTATDCAGEPIAVAVDEFSEVCGAEDFPLINSTSATTVKIDVNKSACSGADVFVTVTMPGGAAAGDDRICTAAIKAGNECSECNISMIGFGCPAPTPEPSPSPTPPPSRTCYN